MITLVQTKNKQGEINPLVKEGVDKNGKAFFSIALFEEAITVNNSKSGTGFIQTQKRMAWVQAEKPEYLAYILLGTMDIKKLVPGAEVKSGRLVRVLSFEPFREDQEPVINPNTKEAALLNGRKYYSKYTWDYNCSMPDTSWEGETPHQATSQANANEPELIDAEQFA
jgi:hypothetical protein|nr:MAG TPA: hypothetical protein [Caudoviricetes sp.]